MKSNQRGTGLYIKGDVLEGVKTIQRERNFPSMSYTARVLLREYMEQLGILKMEDNR